MTDFSHALVLDVGNSCVKWSVWKSGAIDENGRFDGRQMLAVTLASFACELTHKLNSTHAPIVLNLHRESEQVVQALKQQGHDGEAIYVVGAEHETRGLKNGYADPMQLGADRWAAMVAARHHYSSGALLVVDAGTATTVDGISQSNVFSGGLILCGLFPLIRSLKQHFSHLQNSLISVEEWLRDETINTYPAPNNTAAAFFKAALQSQLLVIRESLAALGPEAQLILTGGDALILKRFIKHSCHYYPYLVMEGLRLIAQR